MEQSLKPCPFCGGYAKVIICDNEGNIHSEPGYEDDPWSGLGYKLYHAHEDNPQCPIAAYAGDDGTLGVWIYGTRDYAVEAWNRRGNNAND